MHLLGRADKTIIGDVQGFPGLLEDPVHPVYPSTGRHVRLLGGAQHVLAVLVEPHREERVHPLHSPEPRHHVCPNLL